MLILDAMKKNTAYTAEELASITGMSVPSTVSEIMSLFQQGKVKVKEVKGHRFYAIKE